MLKCDFNKIALQHGCSPVNLLYIFRATFYKNTYEGLLLIEKILITFYYKSFLEST